MKIITGLSLTMAVMYPKVIFTAVRYTDFLFTDIIKLKRTIKTNKIKRIELLDNACSSEKKCSRKVEKYSNRRAEPSKYLEMKGNDFFMRK